MNRNSWAQSCSKVMFKKKAWLNVKVPFYSLLGGRSPNASAPTGWPWPTWWSEPWTLTNRSGGPPTSSSPTRSTSSPWPSPSGKRSSGGASQTGTRTSRMSYPRIWVGASPNWTQISLNPTSLNLDECTWNQRVPWQWHHQELRNEPQVKVSVPVG